MLARSAARTEVPETLATPTRTPPAASATRPSSPRRRPIAVFLILLAVLVVGCIVVSVRRTYVWRLLDDSGVVVRAQVLSVFNEVSGGRGRHGGGYSEPVGDVTYAFDFNGRRFSDTARDVHLGTLRTDQSMGRVAATVLPANPDVHRLDSGCTPRQWSDTLAGCAFMGLFAAVMGVIGVVLWLPERPPPAAPPAEFFTRPEPFLDQAPPRRLRRRWAPVAWTVLFTALVVFPPGYAMVKLRGHFVHRAPGEPVWPWSWATMIEAVVQGLPYFCAAVPAYFIRLARIDRVARLARKGRVTVGVVDWSLKKSRPKPTATFKINGTPITGPPDFKKDWVPYRYEVDGRQLTAESADGRPLILSRSRAIPDAVFLPTGRQVLVLYDPDRPEDSILVPYAKYYFNLTADDATDVTHR